MDYGTELNKTILMARKTWYDKEYIDINCLEFVWLKMHEKLVCKIFNKDMLDIIRKRLVTKIDSIKTVNKGRENMPPFGAALRSALSVAEEIVKHGYGDFQWEANVLELSHLMIAIPISEDFDDCIVDYMINDMAPEEAENMYDTFLNTIIQLEDLERQTRENQDQKEQESNEDTSWHFPDDEFPFAGEHNMSAEEAWKAYTIDLVEQASKKKEDIIGREDVIDSIIRVMARKEKSNVALLGEPGVGKTKVVEGLAYRISKGDIVDRFKDYHIYSVDVSGMVAGAVYRGMFEERFKNVLKIAAANENTILFIDEMHMLNGAGNASGCTDASTILKPYIARGDIKVIGATTYAEYKEIEKDKALERRFTKIDVNEPSREDTIKIINGVKKMYEKHHNVKYTKKAIEAAVDLSIRYMNDRFLPDKAIDLIDHSGAEKSIQNTEDKKITEKDIVTSLSKICKIPVESISEKENDVIKTLDKEIKTKVFGQDEAINEITMAVKSATAGFKEEDKPIGSFLMVGPSGVGKTELAKQLAKTLNIHFVRFDMSEYQTDSTFTKLIGSSIGYMGCEDGGQLINEIRKYPHSVVLFDEIEKADPKIYNVLLQIMDYATCTSGMGEKADFRNCIILMTSNAGATNGKKKSLGFNKIDGDALNRESENEAIEKIFSPEFRGRLSGIIHFNSLNEETIDMIVRHKLEKLNEILKTKKINAEYTDTCISKIKERGVDNISGARGVQTIINNEIKPLFVNEIISGHPKSKYIVDYDEKFILKITKKQAKKKSGNQLKPKLSEISKMKADDAKEQKRDVAVK